MTSPWAQRWRERDRIVPAIAALLVNAIIGYALIIGLRGPSPWRTVVDSAPLALFDLKPPAPEKPQPPRPEKPPKDKHDGGAESAPPPRAQAVRPEPQPRATIITPPPVIAVPAPALPAALPPSGTGGTGLGNGEGRGSGGTGTGTGTGRGEGDGGDFSRARQTGGSFRNSDFPGWLRGVGRLKIGVRYAIAPSGHVDKCEVIEGSGYAEVDAMTCRIIMERYRFRPARDPDGYAVTEVREEDYRWRVR